MIEDIQYPVTPYAFDVETTMGDLRIEMEPTEFDAPSTFKIKTYGGNTAPEETLKRYFHDFGFGMRGHRIDLEGNQAFPSDIYHVLTMSRTHLQEGKQGSILDFQVMGFIPPEGYADLFSDPDEEDNPVFETAAAVRTPVTIEENIQRGKDAMRRVIAQHVNEPKAMYRKDLGWIAFYWGKAGQEPPEFEDQKEMREWWNGLKNKHGLFGGGYGISHIIAKRDWEGKHIKSLIGQKGEDVAMKMVDVIAKGNITKSGQRVKIIDAEYEANLETKYYERERIWVLSGMRRIADDDYKIILESSGEHRFSTMAMPYAPQNFNSHFEVGADISRVSDILNPKNAPVKGIFETASGYDDWRAAIEAATSYEGIEAAFQYLFPITEIK